jgi:hypothetical protein
MLCKGLQEPVSSLFVCDLRLLKPRLLSPDNLFYLTDHREES